MTDLTSHARAYGYLYGFFGRGSRRIDFTGFSGERSAYDAGFQDGQVMLAVRSGEIPAIRPSWPGPAKPRQMLAGDLVATADPEYQVLREMEIRRMKESAYYFLQYVLSVEGLKMPDFYADLAREILDETAVAVVDPSGKHPVKFETMTGRIEGRQPLLHNLPRSEKPMWNACGQCGGTGTTQSASNLEDEECPVCDGTGWFP